LPIYKTTIKIKHLLNHTSGIIDSEYPLALAGYEDDPIEIERVLNFLKNCPDQYFESGSEFAYSNDGYTLLGELVDRVTDQSFAEWMKENIFMPLGMKNTVIRDSPDLVIPHRSTSYIAYTGDQLARRQSFDFYAPGGCSVRSNLNDMVTWINYLNQGNQSEETLFRKINQVDTFASGESVEYAFGNFHTDFRGIERISHLGLSAGFNTSLARFPELNYSFIHLGNDGEFCNYYLSRKIYEIYLSDHLEPKTEKFKFTIPIQDSKDKIENKPPINLYLSDYTGSYFSPQLNASFSFQVKQDTLYALSSAYKDIPLVAIGVDSFSSDEDFMETIVFTRDYEQSVSDCLIYNDDDHYGIQFNLIPNTKPWTTPKQWKSTEFIEAMTDTLHDIEATKVLPGFVVSVFNESETILQKGFGYSNVEKGKEYNSETIQMIASISKSVTGMAAMKAMELGHLSLDDSINDYLPFSLINPKFPDDEITIRHLLTHTSSLSGAKNYGHGYVFERSLNKDNWPEPHHKYFQYYNDNQKMSLSEFLETILSPKGKWFDENLYSDYKPGTNFDYSNLGFALVAYIIELATEVDFQEFTKQHIFIPLGMNASTWELDEVNEKHHITYYLENYNVCPRYSINTYSDGGLFTNIEDLTIFLQEVMKGFAGRGRILTTSSYQEMLNSQTDLIEIEGGLGWDLSIGCCIGHSGNDFGTSTFMYFEPETGIGRIVFTNISLELEELQDAMYGIMNLLFYTDL